MIKTEEALDGTLLYVDGTEKRPVSDPEVQALLRSFGRLQETVDQDGSPEAVTKVFVTSGVRLLARLAATLGHRMQELGEIVDELDEAEAARQEDGGAAPAEGILFTIDEARLLQQPLAVAAETFGAMAANIAQAPQDPAFPPREQIAQSYLQLQAVLGGAAGRLALGLKAHEAAAAEEAAAAQADGDDDGGEGDDDEGDAG